ncbi:unnamed protein product [Polarella glacialis]|uniref:Uncharacterized protein n=1 Tax=Polarella glacialis TaxID=89957 RepID=A0A813EZH4_POLGL|nr:unnamed protein product [Polarella glacialis]
MIHDSAQSPPRFASFGLELEKLRLMQFRTTQNRLYWSAQATPPRQLKGKGHDSRFNTKIARAVILFCLTWPTGERQATAQPFEVLSSLAALLAQTNAEAVRTKRQMAFHEN